MFLSLLYKLMSLRVFSVIARPRSGRSNLDCHSELVSGSTRDCFALRARNDKGETLLEVLISVSILMVIMAPAAGLFMQSNRNTAINQNELIGMGLAEEGLEVMRGLRDTNAIRFSAKFSDCWNTKWEHKTLTDCEAPGNKISASNHFRLGVDLADLDEYKMEETPGALSDDLTGQHDSEYALFLDPETKLYTHDNNGTATPFYRSIEIEYPNDKRMVVRSRVLYRIGNDVRQIRLVRIIRKIVP